MLNTAKRDKRIEEKLKMEQELNEKEKLIYSMKKHIESLNAELDAQEKNNNEAKENSEILGKLFREGVIDDKGNIL